LIAYKNLVPDLERVVHLHINQADPHDCRTNEFDIAVHQRHPEGTAIRIAQFPPAIQRTARFPLLSPELSGGGMKEAALFERTDH